MTVEDEVRAVSRAWAKALTQNNAPLVASFMTNDWVYVGPNGITSRADIIERIASGRLVHHSMSVLGQPRVMHAGDAVVLTARKTSSGTWDGLAYRADEWISEVYTHVDGHWRCLLSHKTQAMP